ncbi:MAG: hypothetical protein HY904_15235 [Deltaproteobacteria bacterium]|nr:hypothetical protein [Deltaproteobacteria bacterium]
MTKAIVRAALECALQGDLARAVATLRQADRGFALKRLKHFARSAAPGSDMQQAANLLLEALNQPAPVPQPEHFPTPRPSSDSRSTTGGHEPVRVLREPGRVTLDNTMEVIGWLANPDLHEVNLDAIQLIHMYGVVALASLARKERESALALMHSHGSSAARFAHSVGLEDAAGNRTPASPGEPGPRRIRS